jgi:hypothetical protein
MPATAACISSATAVMMSSISRRASGANSAEKASILQIAAGQGANARAGDPKWITGCCVIRQHEDVAEQFAHRARLDLAAVRRPGAAALFVPIGEEFTA